MSLKARWIFVFATALAHPLLVYTLIPVLGSTANAFSFMLPAVATLLLGLKYGLAFNFFAVFETAVIFNLSEPMPMPLVNYMPHAILSLSFNTLISIGVHWAKVHFFLHRKAQRALEDTEQEYQQIFENIAEGIICINEQGVITSANPNAAHQLGISIESLCGQTFHTLQQLQEDFKNQVQKLMTQKNPAAHKTQFTTQFISDKDAVRTMDISVSNIHQPDKPMRWILMVKDTTEQRKMETQLQESKRMESIGRLAGGVAHDINNILNAIIGATFALKSDLNSPSAAADLDTIDHACDQGAQLTRNLLGFARKGDSTREVFAIAEVVETVLSIIRRTAPGGISISTKLAHSPILMKGDRGQIESALMNLCLNALDAMGDSGALTIESKKKNDHFMLCVSDTGAGIDESIRELVFEPFFTTKPVGKGTGLGLAMVNRAVKTHGGDISMESEPSMGTTMKITFPQYRGDIVMPEKKEVLSYDATRTPLLDTTILVVDDDPLVLRGSERLLSSLGANVVTAENGNRGLEQFKKYNSSIGLIILDLVMPEMDGTRLLRHIRSLKSLIPVIVVSGYSPEPGKLEELKTQLPRFDFLQKPYRANELLQTMDGLGALKLASTLKTNALKFNNEFR
jgi:two-component system, cell cycle sensor histidine kinase and response regulator CckA